MLVVNLHGTINVPTGARNAIEEFKIEKRFSATVVPDDPSTLGALKLCKDYLAWSPLEKDLLQVLLKERGRASQRKMLDKIVLKDLGFKTHAEMAAKITGESLKFSSLKGIRPFFTLAPPKGGFKRSTRRQYTEGGVLGANPRLPEIVRRMI